MSYFPKNRKPFHAELQLLHHDHVSAEDAKVTTAIDGSIDSVVYINIDTHMSID